MNNNYSIENMSPDLRKRILFLLGALLVFRIASFIPVPGVDPIALANIMGSNALLGMFNVFSGGALSRFSVIAIGIIPYISSSIVMQLASELIPSLKALKKEGDQGRRVITKYTRVGTVILASFQSIGTATLLLRQPGLVYIPKYEFYISTIICLVTGTMFLMWLGEQITERGIGNGVSLIICAGIAANIPRGIGKLLELTSKGNISLFVTLFIMACALVLIYAVVFVESAQRKIPIHYAKKQIGNKIMQGQSSHIPFKLNMAGVIPPIFASSLVMFPTQILSWIGVNTDDISFLGKFNFYFQSGKPLYMLFFAAAIIFFSYFYTALVYSPREISENLKKSGAFIPGIRPGEQTTLYMEKIILRLTFYGSLYITFICLVPELFVSLFKVPIYLGGTSLLILVVVTMDFSIQLSSYKVSQQYEYLMSKTKKHKY